jgi:fatty-acyl-CoA synthase/long-chain acyl-CoA synthetase
MSAKGELVLVHQLLDSISEANLDKVAVVDKELRMTYRQVQRDARQVASALLKAGIRKGDRIGISMPNWHEIILLYFAASKIGAIAVPFSPKYGSYEVEHILNNSEPKVLFACEELVDKIGLDVLSKYVSRVYTVRFERDNCQTFEQFKATGDPEETLPQVELDPAEDLFCILYTSGTTGAPKGVMVTQKGITLSGINIAKDLRCTSDDVFLLPAPLYHIFGMACNLFCSIYSEGRLVLMDVYKARDALQIIQDEKVTVHNAVPTMFVLELNVPDFDSFDLSSLRIGMAGGAPNTLETIKAVRSRMNMEFLNGYGISEAGSVAATPLGAAEDEIIASLGKPHSGVEVRIVDENRQPVPPETVGEIAVRGVGVMKGYYKMPEATAKVKDAEGWFYTGDLGKIDNRGNLHFVGRQKEMIIRGGYNIYPLEIEAVLLKHPKVMNAAVVGVPDPVMGENAVAFIIPRDPSNLTEEELVEYLKPLLADYKVPRKYVFVNEFPMTPSGKIQKVKLAASLTAAQN